MRLANEQLEQELGRLRAAAGWTQAAAEASDDLMLVCDRDLRVRYANPAAVARFGEVEARPSLIAYSSNLEMEQLAQDAMALEQELGLERVIRIDDRPFEARAVAAPSGIALSLSDVTELQRLSRARQDFIANLSHELRTPLTSLRLLVDTLIGPAGRDRKVAAELAAKMAVEVEALHVMAQEMLDLAAIESGQQIVRLISVNLRELAEGCSSRLNDLAQRRRVQLVNAIPADIQVLADPEQAARAILNVLHNAVRFSPEGGVVSLAGFRQTAEDMAVLTVADAGPGIPPADLERIFERFYRGDQPAESPGTGLGLAIARHIMKAHGGHIWADNRKPPERGALFQMAFHPG